MEYEIINADNVLNASEQFLFQNHLQSCDCNGQGQPGHIQLSMNIDGQFQVNSVILACLTQNNNLAQHDNIFYNSAISVIRDCFEQYQIGSFDDDQVHMINNFQISSLGQNDSPYTDVICSGNVKDFIDSCLPKTDDMLQELVQTRVIGTNHVDILEF